MALPRLARPGFSPMAQMVNNPYSKAMSAEISPRVMVNPDVCFGKPTIRGMRIRLSDVLSMLAGGMTPEEILADFPYLEREDITAAIAYQRS